MDRWFVVPGVSTSDGAHPLGPDTQPKYRGRVTYEQAHAIPESDQFLVLAKSEEDELQKLAAKGDVGELDEKDAVEIQYEIQSKREQAEASMPIEPGQGDSIEDRLEDVIEQTNERLVLGDEGIEVSEPSISVGSQLILDSPIPTLDYQELANLGRQLVDLIVLPKASITSVEHHQYLEWNSSFIRFVASETEEFENLVGSSMSHPGPSSMHADFHTMIELVNMPVNMDGADSRVEQFIRSYTQLSGPLNSGSMFRIFGPTSLSLLDGLVKRHCNDLSNDGGNYLGGEVTRTWVPDSPTASSLTYHDRLQYWRTEVANDSIRDSLTQINDLTRYDSDHLENIAGIMGNTEILDRELDSTQHFLAILSAQRNFNIHGRGSSNVIAPIALILACMVFLDELGPDKFEDCRDAFLRAQRN